MQPCCFRLRSAADLLPLASVVCAFHRPQRGRALVFFALIFVVQLSSHFFVCVCVLALACLGFFVCFFVRPDFGVGKSGASRDFGR